MNTSSNNDLVIGPETDQSALGLLRLEITALNAQIKTLSSQIAAINAALPENFSELRISQYGSIEEVNTINKELELDDLY